MSKKQIDRHTEDPDTPYTFRILTKDLETIRRIAKTQDRTRGAILREAVREWIERRSA